MYYQYSEAAQHDYCATRCHVSAIAEPIQAQQEALPVCLWQEKPHRPVSLYEMFQRDAARFVWIGVQLQSMYSNVIADTMPGAHVTEDAKIEILESLSGTHQTASEMGMFKTVAVLAAAMNDYEGAVWQTQAHLNRCLNHIQTAFITELGEHLFVQIDPARIKYMKTVEEFAVEPIFGQPVADAFRSATDDIREAGNCYAANRATACVFHCMRALEISLRALANELKVSFKIPFEYQEWQNVIGSIEAEIRTLEKQPRGLIKSESLKFYSQAAMQFFYFKHAWRNHVAHSRESYGGEQALTVLTHVGAFMTALAEGGLRDDKIV